MVLPDTSLEKWKYKKHTQIKHKLLSKYIVPWSKILGKFYNLIIFDCFAGRGRYKDGEDGSPLIIMKTIAKIKKNLKTSPKKIKCVFIEKSEKNFQNLEKEINQERVLNPKKYNGWLEIECYCDKYENVVNTYFNNISERLDPSFFFLDPFGFKGIPFELIRRIMSKKRMEIFITFMVKDINRFMEFLEKSSNSFAIKKLFGSEDVSKIIHEKYSNFSKDHAILKLYTELLKKSANVKYIIPYKISADDREETLYYLIHCSNHPLGCEIMKEIMYNTGTKGRLGYYGPIEGQMLLTQYAGIDIYNLKILLLERFQGKILTYQKIRYNLINDFPQYSKKQFKKALLELEEEKIVRIEGKGTKGALKETSIIKFFKNKNIKSIMNWVKK